MYGNGKGKVRPRTGHEGPEGEQRYGSTLSLASALDEGGWQTPRPGRLTPGKETRYSLRRRQGGPHSRSRRMRKISPPPGSDPQTVQPVSRPLNKCVCSYALLHLLTSLCIHWLKYRGTLNTLHAPSDSSAICRFTTSLHHSTLKAESPTKWVTIRRCSEHCTERHAIYSQGWYVMSCVHKDADIPGSINSSVNNILTFPSSTVPTDIRGFHNRHHTHRSLVH
jgi:hypothetical protein